MSIRIVGIFFIIFGLIEMIIGNLIYKFGVFKNFMKDMNENFKNNIGQVTMIEGMCDVAVGSFAIITNSFGVMMILIFVLIIVVLHYSKKLY